MSDFTVSLRSPQRLTAKLGGSSLRYYMGRIGRDGTLYGPRLGGWSVAHPETGDYKITHNLHLVATDYCVLLQTSTDPAGGLDPGKSFAVVLHVDEQSADWFHVLIREGKPVEPIDVAFGFAVLL